MGRPPDPARREEVLVKAVAYLAERGLSNLSLRKLASAMGTSTQTISYQFGSKEGLIEAALARARATTLGVLEEIRAEQIRPSVADGIVRLWDWWLEDQENLVSTRLSMEAMMTSDEDLSSERRPELLSFWIDYFADWILVERDGSRQDAIVQSTLLMAVLSGLVIDLQSTGDRQRTQSSLHAYLAAIQAYASSGEGQASPPCEVATSQE
ncbi:TetR/AcrR family transcriptional regulator [Paenarthrobacter sp. NPDC056912]|uniref:TetR/AcrR family transcriptional regulator n=1 Tax=Paenarthrobacter sp. NPDC056912 TaxID=3345965 RepID=UPI00366DBE61